ncbi:chaperone protein HtpG [Halolactibacillus alkaliphilus]|uniref:Chaperone protein HtpG n=1 Tax=Halolactibacillus alkaliphilus TaxID=442899 RepID=A0A511WZW9_9BACI|nr:molecular chaperone HtpG [Halolactibacillus alkaliphilus]GEN56221.1 chaperone protein HtpG [Halolactibacillus alkaliphilus]GGN66513.1 chaperone protein HtpG [Halolactibacillus alkaliphilus]SFO67766.1 molecular chaperone HtpG [Halolactibacillus alkaliphilus]
MTVKQFEAESKRLLDMMIHSIYSKREVFLRELISNASDAMDKMYYRALTDDKVTFNQSDYYIKISTDKDNRTLTISDNGIGMTKEELEQNLGTIAKSGSLAFKKDNEIKDGFDIIGQFGVGFYAAFMVADKVSVTSRAVDQDQAYHWYSEGAEGYAIEEATKETVGTTITLTIKESNEDDDFEQFLDLHQLQTIVKTYSDFIRYPIKMDLTEEKLKEGTEDEYETIVEEKIVNSMVPIWKKNKTELTDDDYKNFYHEKHYGFDNPLTHVHVSVDGNIRYQAILYVPETAPYNYYSQEFEKGLELYSNGVLIKNKAPELLPDYFSFVKGLVDSEDLSLNISREMLQHDRQLKLIEKNLVKKIKQELKKMLMNDREKYETFFKAFGRQLKYGVYSDFGQNKETLKDLILFYSSTEEKLVTLAEYVERMKDDQKYIYYATGESHARIERLPQTEIVRDKGYEILYFTDDIDEFAIKMLMNYDDKEFKSVSSVDLGFEDDATDEKVASEEDQAIFDQMKEILKGKVADVRLSKRLKTHPVCLSNEGDISIEMEKVLSMMPDNQGVKAEKVLEINTDHDIFKSLKHASQSNEDMMETYTNVLYNQALLIEGLPVEDPVSYANDVWKVMK